MKVRRFLIIATVFIAILSLAVGALSITSASAQAVCGSATPISVPFSKDGAGTFCYQATSMCYAINSWSMNSLQINGNNYTNMWVSGPSIPALNGVFTITYNGGQVGHFEIAGPCSSGSTNTPTRTPTQVIAISTTPALTATRTRTPGTVSTSTRTRTPTNGPALTATRTNTLQPPTLTHTPTTAGQGISLKVQYMPGNISASTTAIQPKIRIVNTGSVSVPLADIGVQYWYTWNGTQPHDFSQETITCIATTIPGGCASLTESEIVPLNPAHLAGDSMVVNTFQLIGTAEITPGQSYDIEYRVTKNDSSLYNQADDYSFNASFTTYTDWPKITLFHQVLGNLWGVQPIVPTPTVTPGPSPTATLPGGVCTPVTGTIVAPFAFNGPGTFCWQSNNLGSFVNSWNTSQVTINGMNVTNVFAMVSSLPPQINGFWYVSYSAAVQFGHFEANP